MQTKLELRAKLLNTGLFLDNKYLDQYLDLVLEKKQNSGYTEKHHILQRNYFKKNKIPIDNSEDNLITLTYCDHCKAHWLLYFCTIDYLKQANMHSVRYINEMYKKLTDIEKPKFDFNQEDFELLQSYMNNIINDSESRYWSQAEINYLKENYRGYGTGLKCAKALNRPLKLVNEKAKQLGLSICCPNWTSDELEILKKYYPIEGTKVYLRLPKHSEAACRAQATKLKIKVQTHYWSKDDIKKFEDNADKPLTEITKLFPNRTYASIKHYWQRYIKEKIKNGKNNDRRKN